MRSYIITFAGVVLIAVATTAAAGDVCKERHGEQAIVLAALDACTHLSSQFGGLPAIPNAATPTAS